MPDLPKFNAGDKLTAASLQRLSDNVGSLWNWLGRTDSQSLIQRGSELTRRIWPARITTVYSKGAGYPIDGHQPPDDLPAGIKYDVRPFGTDGPQDALGLTPRFGRPGTANFQQLTPCKVGDPVFMLITVVGGEPRGELWVLTERLAVGECAGERPQNAGREAGQDPGQQPGENAGRNAGENAAQNAAENAGDEGLIGLIVERVAERMLASGKGSSTVAQRTDLVQSEFELDLSQGTARYELDVPADLSGLMVYGVKAGGAAAWARDILIKHASVGAYPIEIELATLVAADGFVQIPAEDLAGVRRIVFVADGATEAVTLHVSVSKTSLAAAAGGGTDAGGGGGGGPVTP